MVTTPRSLIDAPFTDTFVRALPGDETMRPGSRQVPGVCYSLAPPTPVSAPTLLAWSDDLGASLGLTRPPLGAGPVADVLAGNHQLPGMRPYAARYGGHQFGHWAGQLGDGRAITLGELVASDGERWDLQLKGAGRTPYSRQADGRAVLRSSLREFLCSEAMHALGIPTTRALSLVATGESVVRDMFYDGHPTPEPGAIVCRVAPTFVRVGSFEIHAALGETDVLRQLADYVLTTHYGECGPPSSEAYVAMFVEVCRRTARLAAHWTRVGFVHGVLNTDNMSILGLTIDYGPYGWLEGYDPTWTPNTTDAAGRRYRFGQQPNVALWNMARFGEALIPLLDDPEGLQAGLEAYRSTFDEAYGGMLADKLGLQDLDIAAPDALVSELFALLEAEETDMTIFFRGLADVPPLAVDADALLAPVRAAFYSSTALEGTHGTRVVSWLRDYAARTGRQGLPDRERRERMQRANPKYVLRNYLAQEAIDETAEGRTDRLERLLRVLARPYDDQPGEDDLAARRPEWARHRAGCSMLSCSS